MKVVAILGLFLASLAICKANIGMAIGGFGESDSVAIIESDRVCLGYDTLPPVPKAPIGRFAWVAQYVDDAVFLCGGADVDIHNDCYSLTLGSSSWQTSCSLVDTRRYPASLVFNGEMVVMGGYNVNQGWLDSVEKKTMGQCSFTRMDQWKMPRKLFDHCALQIDSTHIMLIGGNQYGEFEITNVDILDTTTGTWTAGPDLPVARDAHACVVTEHNGEQGVMVTGGCGDNCRFHLTETLFYSFASKTWTDIGAPLSIGRMGHKMMVLNGKPTVIGGFKSEMLNTIEEFDGQKWVTRADKLPHAAFFFAMPESVPDKVSCQ